ncbi:MAG: hypothetical protein H6622_01355 [Halobacteriovoraceae bacterium]|nr:hypothetical protein [Halobacteriovoraceae bacterium]
MFVLKLLFLFFLGFNAYSDECSEIRKKFTETVTKFDDFQKRVELKINECLLSNQPIQKYVDVVLDEYGKLYNEDYTKIARPSLRSRNDCYKSRINPYNNLVVSKRMFDANMIYLLKYCSKKGRSIREKKLAFFEEKKILKQELLNICGEKCKLFGNND